jgi:GDP-4-dehydro-6-deoxy-D-mannose reductase
VSAATRDTDAHRAPPGSPLVTGGNGFAGRHLVALLSGGEGDVVAPPSSDLDLCDGPALRNLIGALAPGAVFHLAAFSSPILSWDRPRDAVVTNIEMTLNVLEAVRHEAPAATVVLVGSGQVYGAPAELPIAEDAPRAPGNPYAVSKVSCELLGRQYSTGFGMRVVQLHPFNHAGPGQSDEYVVSSLARQVAEAEAHGLAEAVLRTGNPDSARDFTDVRDVVRAYALAAELDGGTFNVCSGRSASVRDLVEVIRGHARIPVKHEIDPARLRANDARDLRGSHDRLTEATGWQPEIPLEQTVADTLDWWRAQLAR